MAGAYQKLVDWFVLAKSLEVNEHLRRKHSEKTGSDVETDGRSSKCILDDGHGDSLTSECFDC
jgi:hypothetical protein